MYLSTQRTKLLADLCAVMAENHSKQQMLESLAEPLIRLMQADHLVSRQHDPVTNRYAICASHNVRPSRIRAYEEHFQFCDPITPRLNGLRTPARVSDVCNSQELERSEFYNDHLKQDGIYWGLNLYAYQGDACLGDLVIYRARARDDFSRDDLACLNFIAPMFNSALSRHQSTEHPPRRWMGHDETILRQLLSSRCRLSQRESEVIMLCLHGSADKEIALTLNIGFTTVRYHLGNAFMKLDIQGRNKLEPKIGALLGQA